MNVAKIAWTRGGFSIIVAVSLPLLVNGSSAHTPGDHAYEFTSSFDGSQQAYRIFLPPQYDGKVPFPMLVALHGTGGDQNKYFDHAEYHNGIYKKIAAERGLIVLCPLGTDAKGLPTEWRGEAEINVLGLIDEVCNRFRIDPDRIVCTGQSMGGTGTSYLCCRYPDLFAGGVPLASTYGHLSLITNLRHVPMFYVQGAEDWPIYAATGPIPITKEMERLGYSGKLWMVPKQKHNTMGVSTERVIDWALKQHREAHPRHITHRAYFPPHGRAWWVEITAIEKPGWFAEVVAKMEEKQEIVVQTKNASGVILRPDPVLYNPNESIQVTLNGERVFEGICGAKSELRLEQGADGWTAEIRQRRVKARTEWQESVLGKAVTAPDWSGSPETTLGNWLTDAMREISGVEIAIISKGHYRIKDQFRNRSIEPGKPLRFMEMINWIRPSDSALAEFSMKGKDFLELIEMNLGDEPKAEMGLIQVSGCRYRFDRRREMGNRITWSDIEADRDYKIVCNSSQITRGDTIQLGRFFGALNEQILEPNLLSTAWHHIVKNGGMISATLEGRVVEEGR